MSSNASITVSKILTNYSQMLQNEEGGFIGDKVLPPVGVSSRTGKFYRVSGGFGAAVSAYAKRAPGGRFNTVNLTIAQVDAYTCAEAGLDTPVDDQQVDEAAGNGLKLEYAATKRVLAEVRIAREVAAATLLFSTTTFSGKTAALTGTNQWSDPSSDVFAKVAEITETVRLSCGKPREAQTLVIGAPVWRYLSVHPQLVDRMKFTSKVGVLNQAQVAEALMLQQVLVGNGIYNSAAEGQTESNTNIWGDYALFAFIDPSPEPMSAVGLGMTPQMVTRPQGQVEKYREEPRTTRVLVTYDEQQVVVNTSCGYLLSDLIA